MMIIFNLADFIDFVNQIRIYFKLENIIYRKNVQI